MDAEDGIVKVCLLVERDRLRAANVLLIGVRGLGSEIAKDILLSGINSLTILDDGAVTEEEQVKNFLLDKNSIGENIAKAVLLKAQALNPLVKIVADTEPFSSKSDEFFGKFTIIIGTGLRTEQIISVSASCRKHNVKFICGDVFGMFGYSLADFQEHQYFEDQVKIIAGKKRTHDGKLQNVERTTVKVQNTLKYPELREVLTLPEATVKAKRRNPYFYLMLVLIEFRNKYGRDPSPKEMQTDIEKLLEIRNHILPLYQVSNDKLNDDVFGLLFGELVSICSIVGGVIAQEVIKAVSHKEVPINNVFLFDPISYNGKEETVGDVH